LSDWEPIQYEPTEMVGGTKRFHAATWKRPELLIGFIERELSEGRSVMVAGACSYHVGPMVNVLRRHAIPFANPWRRRRGDWNPLAPRRGVSTVDRLAALVEPVKEGRLWTLKELGQWGEVLQSDGVLRWGGKGRLHQMAETKSEAVADFELLMEVLEVNVLSIVWELAYDKPDAVALARWWHQNLSPKAAKVASYPVQVVRQRGVDALRQQEPMVYPTTIHAAKGAEADTVIIFPDLSPAGDRQWGGSPQDRDAIVRLGYVGITRAKQNLVVCAPEGQQAMPLLAHL